MITNQEFENDIIQKNLDSIENYMLDFFEKNQLKPIGIDIVFMSGGTSMVRLLRIRFFSHFGEDKIKSCNNSNSVAMGLAYSFRIFKER